MKQILTNLTAARLREVLHYEPDTGVFIWRAAIGRRINVGVIAGCDDALGYRTIKVDGDLYLGHRLAWLYVTGLWPNGGLDHLDGDPSNNRFSNLRLASQRQNTYNKKMHANNRSGFKGVHWHGRERVWNASIYLNNKSVHLGTFDTPERAFIAYAFAAWKHFGDFARIDADYLRQLKEMRK